MYKRLVCTAFAAGIVVAVFISGGWINAAAQDQPEAQAQPAAQDQPEDRPSITIRYADACLRLAELELKQVEEMNSEIPHLVQSRYLERLKTNVYVAKQQLKLARQLEHGSTKPMQQACAEANVKLAETELNVALNAKKREPGSVTGLEIERLRVKVEVWQLRAAMWRDPHYVPSLLDQMQWQIDRLTEQVIELNHQVRNLESRK